MKKILFFAISVLFASTVLAQTDNKNTGALLWKISGNGLKHPSYIFGTHHLYPLSFFDSIAGAKQMFELCEQMVGELVTRDIDKLTIELQKAGMMPKDTTWKMLLSDDEYAFVDEQLIALLGFGINVFGIYKPALAILTYSGVFYKKLCPQLSSEEVIDVWLQQQAVRKGIPVIGLETVQEQVAALFNVSSLQRQADNLVCYIKNTDLIELSAKKINHLYSIADLKGLHEILFLDENPCPSSAEEQIAINEARNQRWLAKLPAIMADKPSFIAVGGGHLFGEVGLLIGLEQIGFIVEAVVETCNGK